MAGRALIVAVLGACALAPATATAGSYDVYSCKVGSAFYGNNAWAGANNAGARDPAFTAPKTTCANASDPLVALMRPAAAGATVAYAAPASSALHLDAPADTRITDFALTVRHWFSTPSNVGFNLLLFGTKGVSLAGAWDSTSAGDQAAINAERHWYGAGAAVDSGSVTITKADSPQAQRQGSAASIFLYAGCATGTCTFDQNSINQLQLFGSRVTIEDDLPPDITAVQAGQGLLAAGVRSGAEPITFSASDNSGIRRAEIVDVTDTVNQSVVASEDYNTDRTPTWARDATTPARVPVRTSRTRRSPRRRPSPGTERSCCV